MESVRPPEIDVGSGLGLDRAFRHSTGRWDVPIAVLDSGFLWQSEDLVSKIWLHAGELPLPIGSDGEVAASHDADGNGVFNIDDYAQDPRVLPSAGVDVADEILDPSDLIYTFSDGIDDDSNGYIDDISGWDFFGRDNDPYASLELGYADHGTAVARRIAEPAEDGEGVGVCPNCAILPVRVGDTFVTDGDRLSQAMVFATDSGARVIAVAVGALTNPVHSQRAIGYADDHGVVIIGAAGDENSYHRNFPAVDPRVLYVHSVRANTANENGGGVYSYQNFWNCNNYGPRVDVVAASSACATGAVALIAGTAGLMVSVSQDQGLSLTPGEIRSILRGTAHDVWLSESELVRAQTYPSQRGRDAFYGEGKVSGGAAVEAVVSEAIPPLARIDSPDWFAWVSPEDPVLRVEGEISAPRSEVAWWTLEQGSGAEPSEWTPVAEGTQARTGLIAEIDLSALNAVVFDPLSGEGVVERMLRAHEPLVQLRLTVEDEAGLQSVEYRGVWAQPDPDLLEGFPKHLGSSLDSGPQIADVDGDGVLELVLAGSGGELHVLRGDGSSLPGFPVMTPRISDESQGWTDAPVYVSGELPLPREGMLATPAVGDLDGDGTPEIVAATLKGSVIAWTAEGRLVHGFPARIQGRARESYQAGRAWDDGVAGAPALGDIDGDGDLEIVIAALDQRLYVWDGDGTPWPGSPLDLCDPVQCDELGARSINSPALGDIDADGDLDAVVATNESPSGPGVGTLWAVDLASMQVHEGWPVARPALFDQALLPVIGEGHPGSPALVDLDGDGDLEILSQAMLGAADPIHHDGTPALELAFEQDFYGPKSTFSDTSFLAVANPPAVGDLDQDGVPDVMWGGGGVSYLVSITLAVSWEYQHGIGVWSGATGQPFAGWPRQVDDMPLLATPSVADVSGDGLPEVLMSSSGHFLNVADAEGTVPEGFPKFTGGWAIGAPAVGDITGDGKLDIVLTTRDGWVLAWRTQGRSRGGVEWMSTFHDPQNTGNYEAPLPPPVAASGCCGAKGQAGVFPLLALPILWIRRRRSSEC